MTKEKNSREKPIPENKKEFVKKTTELIEKSNTILLASIKGLPGSQFQAIKKKLRGKAEVIVARKALLERAFDSVKKKGLSELKQCVRADIAVLISNIDAFSLAGELVDSQSPTKAKIGDIAPEDINVEPGPTDLMPGPAISELGSVGLKVAVENGKLAIKNSATLVKKGEAINEKVSAVLGKLKIEPIKVGFIPVAAYNVKEDVVYKDIKIDKKGAYEELKSAINKALGFAIKIGYAAKETVGYFIAKAGMEEKALERVVENKQGGAQ